MVVLLLGASGSRVQHDGSRPDVKDKGQPPVDISAKRGEQGVTERRYYVGK